MGDKDRLDTIRGGWRHIYPFGSVEMSPRCPTDWRQFTYQRVYSDSSVVQTSGIRLGQLSRHLDWLWDEFCWIRVSLSDVETSRWRQKRVIRVTIARCNDLLWVRNICYEFGTFQDICMTKWGIWVDCWWVTTNWRRLTWVETKLHSICYEFEADGKFTKFENIYNNLKQLWKSNDYYLRLDERLT